MKKYAHSIVNDVVDIARLAGNAIMEIYKTSFDIYHKEDNSPLTNADLAANKIITEHLQQISPHIPILSEESPYIEFSARQHWETYWLIDPLDGTRSFVNREDEFSVNIALIHRHQAILGVIQSPVTQEVWFAVKDELVAHRSFNQETLLLPQYDIPAPTHLRVALGRTDKCTETILFLDKIKKNFTIEKVSLSSALKFGKLAEGKIDLYPRFYPTSEWDTAAGQCILEEVGGKLLSTKDLKPFEYNRRDSLENKSFYAFANPNLVLNIKG